MDFLKNLQIDDLFISKINSIFEADEDKDVSDTSKEDDNVNGDTSNIEISPPPENLDTQNSSIFLDNKVSNSFITNDPAIHNLIEIISADMEDQDNIKPYVDNFFTRIGLNDIDPEKFKPISSEIWNKLDGMSEMDPKTSLSEFTNWARQKINEANRV